MVDRTDPRALFLDSLARIERVAALVCASHGVWGAEAEDFASWVKERLIENDYDVLRKYRGESELNTYLATVVAHLFQEHARERLGRWRNSAAAERLGQLAKELEALVHRDGYSLGEAGERLRSAGRTHFSDVELARLLARLPTRGPLRPVEAGTDPLVQAPNDSRADERVRAEEAERHRDAVLAALSRAMESLEPEERMIVRMNLADGHTVADVARALNIGQRALYRRVERLREQLRRALESEGISVGDVRELIHAIDLGTA